ncbi:MAG: right-handed parallel beta-helix repeat-containing protein [Candidatus Binatia bacterium]
MGAIIVHPTDPQADASSLTQAITRANDGDVIFVQPGHYSPTRTGERLPLTLPPGVSLIGVAASQCIIDGEGQFAPSFNPIATDLSVLVLGDYSSVCRVTVTNGGGHGIAVPPGASAIITHTTLSRHGDHGIFLCGVANATITYCEFFQNGLQRFEPALPRGVGARQGHHIFAEARAGQRNQIQVSDNVMRECFADGLAFICFFPEPDAVEFHALVQRNTIEQSERGGLLCSGSFGPSHNKLRLVVTDNILRDNKQVGISLIGALPLAAKVPQATNVQALLSGNTISGSPVGLLAQAAIGEARQNSCRLTVESNQFTECSKSAIRLVGAMGMENVKTEGNELFAFVTRNSLPEGASSVLVQGAGGPATGTIQDNTASVRFLSNVSATPPEHGFIISNGLPGNRADVLSGSQPATRAQGNIL